jgi:hypothetical protein
LPRLYLILPAHGAQPCITAPEKDRREQTSKGNNQENRRERAVAGEPHQQRNNHRQQPDPGGNHQRKSRPILIHGRLTSAETMDNGRWTVFMVHRPSSVVKNEGD